MKQRAPRLWEHREVVAVQLLVCPQLPLNLPVRPVAFQGGPSPSAGVLLQRDLPAWCRRKRCVGCWCRGGHASPSTTSGLTTSHLFCNLWGGRQHGAGE